MTDQHIFDDLPRLLSGEADRATVVSAAAHLRGCEDCRQELISALVAHASLSSAARFAPEINARPDRELPDTPVTALPDLSSMFSQVREEAEARSAAPVRSSRTRWLVAAAVVGAAAVAGGAVAITNVNGSSADRQSVALAAYDHGQSPAKAVLEDGKKVTLDATSLPDAGNGKLYEVWLTNSERTKMYAVGSLDSNRKGSFTVSADLMKTYSAIEVSVQPFDSSSYSGISVLRGSYAS